MPPETTTRHAVGVYAPPEPRDAADAPITPRSLGMWLPLLGLIASIGIAWGIVETRLEGKLGNTEYQRDRAALETRLGEMQGDIRVIRACVVAKNPEVCR